MKYYRFLIIFLVALVVNTALANLGLVQHPILIKGEAYNNSYHSWATDMSFDWDGFGYATYTGVPGAKQASFFVEMLPNSTLTVFVDDLGVSKIYCDLIFSNKKGEITAIAKTEPSSDMSCQFSGTPNQPNFTLTFSNRNKD